VAEATVMFLVVTSRCRLPEGGAACNIRSKARLRREAFAIRVTNRKRFARVRRLRQPEGLCRCGQPEGCAVHALESGGGALLPEQ